MAKTRRFRVVLPDGTAMSADYAGAEVSVRF
jgi:hypothetical protein